MRITDLPVPDDLHDELAARNHVRAVKFEYCRRDGATWRKRVMDEIHEGGQVFMPHLIRVDHLRALAGRPTIYLEETLRRFGGELLSVTPNIRTDMGKDFVANALGGTQPTMADWIALSNNNAGTSASHTGTTSPLWGTAEAADAAAAGTRGEYTGVGMARKVSTYAHTVNTTSYTLTATWTATGAVTAVQIAGNFGGSTKNTQGSSATTNILFLENTFTATTLANNDQLSLTWTVNI